jgi:hypothetical protein
MKMTPCSLVEIYERFEQPAAFIFKVEDGGSRLMHGHRLVNVVTSSWQSFVLPSLHLPEFVCLAFCYFRLQEFKALICRCLERR